MAKCKCDPHDICEECPEWIFTLADLIMCMMGLFVILWVLKPGGASPTSATSSAQSPSTATMSPELVDVLGQIRKAFGYTPDPNSTDPVDVAILLRELQAVPKRGDGEKGTSTQRPDGAEGTDPTVKSIRIGRESIVGAPVQFERGSVELTSYSKDTLGQIGKLIRGHRQVVMVKGHAALDDLPEGATAQQYLDLSLRRAQMVADALVAMGVSPDILRVQGCSTFEPIVQRAYDTAGRAINRRVEVEVTNILVQQLQDRPRGEPVVEPKTGE
jgi:outer membrane protein OmpA-like peptidoglycan-associated protein